MNPSNKYQLDKLYTPTINCPIPYSCHPLHEEAHLRSLEWALKMGLVDSTQSSSYIKLEKAKFAWLGAATYPFVNETQLYIAADYMVWFFIYDDLYVNPDVPDCFERLAQVQERLIAAMEGEPLLEDDVPVVRGIHDIFSRIYEERGKEGFWLDRLRQHMKDYWNANIWSLQIYQSGKLPTLSNYRTNRMHDIGLIPTLDISAHWRNIDVSNEFFTSDLFEQMSISSAVHVYMVNDILGVEKEIMSNESVNAVFVLQQEMETEDLGQAYEQAIKLCNNEMETYLSICDHLEDNGIVVDEHVQNYIKTCNYWIRGHIDWYSVSGRYKVTIHRES